MVSVAESSVPRVALVGLPKVKVIVSSGSFSVSSRIEMVKVRLMMPGVKVSTPPAVR